MTSFRARHRATAIAATEETCPRCGAGREPDQRFCLECGLALPAVSGRVASLRRRWITRLGWYPGDWVWATLLNLAVAVVCAVAAIVLSHKDANNGTPFVAPPPVVTTTPITTAPTTTPGTTTAAPTTTAAAPPPTNGRLSWPASENGWTIVLVSYPKTTGHDAAVQTAAKAAKAGLTQVGVLDSSLYASLQPGYYVVFTGIYGSKSDADAAVATARQAGFGGAYSRQVAR
ncbi:MAG TPA: zinc ribbon domain-containing protein [Gaiellaceae bacterium]|nr:zinc ribbon domain-containing protein [Gaiellaceae bacterium]